MLTAMTHVEMQRLIGVYHRANIHLTNVQKHLNYLRRNYKGRRRFIQIYKELKVLVGQ